MTNAQAIINRYQEVRSRLINPPNAVPDKPINMHPNRIPKGYAQAAPVQPVLENQLTCKVVIEVIHKLVEPKKLRLSSINKAVCKHYGISMAEIKSHQRKVKQMIPRHIIFYLACCHTGLSLPQIGRRIGGRDHTTIMHGREQIKKKLLVDENLQATIKMLEYRLFAGIYDTDNLGSPTPA